VSSIDFRDVGYANSNRRAERSDIIYDRMFRSFFGTSPEICSDLWTLLHEVHPDGDNPIHLLYALLFLKSYNTEYQKSCTCGCDPKTFRKWCWIYVELMGSLEIVSLRYHRELIAR
jgi:hypothetical protein